LLVWLQSRTTVRRASASRRLKDVVPVATSLARFHVQPRCSPGRGLSRNAPPPPSPRPVGAATRARRASRRRREAASPAGDWPLRLLAKPSCGLEPQTPSLPFSAEEGTRASAGHGDHESPETEGFAAEGVTGRGRTARVRVPSVFPWAFPWAGAEPGFVERRRALEGGFGDERRTPDLWHRLRMRTADTPASALVGARDATS
jgi:hypothetical protein